MLPANDWGITGSHTNFISRALGSHTRVKTYQVENSSLYTIQRNNRLSPVIALFVDRYTISLADVMMAKSEFPQMTCIVAAGSWCGYTREAKQYGLEHNIGVFNAKEFLGALSFKRPTEYTMKDQDGEPSYAYRS